MEMIKKKFLALGDSYTIGEAVDYFLCFPVQTVKMLQKPTMQISNPHIIATTGWTTTDLIASLNTGPPNQNYDIVTLLIGVNNQYQGKPLSTYKKEFALLLERAISYAANIQENVFVLSIPDYSVMPFANTMDRKRITREIDIFNEANKLIALDAGVQYVDITPISREAESDLTLVAKDKLHPSGSQYEKWSRILASMIEKK